VCVLVVDDDDELRAVIMDELGNSGVTPVPAADADSAIERIDGSVDVLLTDLMLPGINGVELIERARAQRPDLPAILMTGAATSEIPPLPPGVVLLRKPFPMEALIQEIDRALC